MDERNYNDKNEFIMSVKRSLRRFKSCVKKGVIYFYDKYNDDVQFSQVFPEDVKDKIEEERENK
jgi:hypothetical protein